MKIAIDISPLRSGHYLWHRVRGTGYYIENLKKSLLKYYPQNEYVFFSKEDKVPESIDILHIPYFEPFFLTLPLRKKYKTIVTVHDLTPLVFPKQFPSGIKGKLKWQVQKRSLSNADAIITDSESSKKDIIKYAGIPPKKIHVVYLAASNVFKKVEKSSILGSIREKYKLPKKFVLYVGDVTWNKNLPALIKAVNEVKVPLVMVGKALVSTDFDRENPWNQDLIEIQGLIGENKRIICLGFVPSEDLVMLYNIATVFVMPSLYEGFGLPVLEAMSCGCPVITSKEGSLQEITGNSAYYIDAYDLDNIAKGLNEVYISKKLQEELSVRGLAQAKKFSWVKTADQTEKIYSQLV